MLFNKIKYFFYSADEILLTKVIDLNLESVALFGCGELGIAVFSKLKEHNIDILGWFDSSIPKGEHYFMGVRVYSPSELSILSPPYLIIASEAYASEIVEQCRIEGYCGKVISLEKNK